MKCKFNPISNGLPSTHRKFMSLDNCNDHIEYWDEDEFFNRN